MKSLVLCKPKSRLINFTLLFHFIPNTKIGQLGVNLFSDFDLISNLSNALLFGSSCVHKSSPFVSFFFFFFTLLVGWGISQCFFDYLILLFVWVFWQWMCRWKKLGEETVSIVCSILFLGFEIMIVFKGRCMRFPFVKLCNL